MASATEAPGGGVWFAAAAGHPTLPRGSRERLPVLGPLAEILTGPSHDPEGRCNLFGALRVAMAMAGCATIREFHTAAVLVVSGAPGLVRPGGESGGPGRSG